MLSKQITKKETKIIKTVVPNVSEKPKSTKNGFPIVSVTQKSMRAGACFPVSHF